MHLPCCLGDLIEHLTPYTLSPTNLIAGRSTWEWEGHKTKTHAFVTRAGCVDHIRKNTVTRKIVQLGVTVVFTNVGPRQGSLNRNQDNLSFLLLWYDVTGETGEGG